MVIQLVEEFGDEQLVLLLPDIDCPAILLDQTHPQLVSLPSSIEMRLISKRRDLSMIRACSMVVEKKW